MSATNISPSSDVALIVTPLVATVPTTELFADPTPTTLVKGAILSTFGPVADKVERSWPGGTPATVGMDSAAVINGVGFVAKVAAVDWFVGC